MKTMREACRMMYVLERAGINYALIRNFDRIVSKKPYKEKDIDLLIDTKDKKKTQQAFIKSGFKKLLICPFAGHYGFVKYLNGKFLSFHLHVGGVSGASIPYLDAKTLLGRKKEKNKIFILSDEDQLLALLLHSFLDSGTFRPKYCKKINQLLRKSLDWNYIENMLSEKSNKLFADKIITYLKQRKYGRLENVRNPFRKKFYFANFLRTLKVLKTKIAKYSWAGYRLFKNAPLVSFIGIDGTGKTTMTNMLKQRLGKSLITNSLVYTGRGRYNILPIQFFGQKYKKIEEKRKKRTKTRFLARRKAKAFLAKQTKKNKKQKISITEKIIYTLAAPIFAFDLFLRYWLIIWLKRKTKQIVITDRYSIDILLMANVPMLLKKIMYLFFSKPTLTIYLYNTPRILHRRKKDHSIEDLYRQKKLFSGINKKVKPWKIKSSNIDKNIDCICKKVCNII